MVKLPEKVIKSFGNSYASDYPYSTNPFLLWLAMLADFLLAIEPVWLIPILVYSYAHTLSIVPGPSYTAWIGISIACIPFILQKIRWGYFSIRSAFELPAALLIIGAIVGLLVSIDFPLSIRTFQSLLLGALTYYLAINYKHPRALMVSFSFIFFLLWLAIPSLALLQRLTLTPGQLTSPWLLRLAEWLPQVSQPLIGEEAILTQGSTYGVAYPLMVCASILLGIAFFHKNTFLRIASILIFVIVVAIMVSVAGYSISRLFSGATVDSRMVLWKDTVHMLRQNPITGLGLGMPLLFTYGSFESEIHHPHNSYLELYANAGLLGVIAAVIAFIIAIGIAKSILRANRKSSWYGIGIGLFMALLFSAFFSLVDTFLSGHIIKYSGGYYYVMSLAPWILGAGLVMSRRILNESD